MIENVFLVHNTRGRECYIAIGRHNIYFVSKEMQDLIEGRYVSYLDIARVVVDKETNRRILIELIDRQSNPSSGGWEEDRILIWSRFRQELIDRIALCWQAEYMYKNYEVKKFPAAQASLPLTAEEEKFNVDHFTIKPFQEYGDDFQYRGYTFMLRDGFEDYLNMRSGTYVHDIGWEVLYGVNKVALPPGMQVTVHVHDPIPIMELERDPDRDDLRSLATSYKRALVENMSQFFVVVNSAYNKRLNRSTDIASWDGWELLIRSEHFAFVCILLRRMYIPPLCDLAQDLAVLLRCPAKGMTHHTCEVLLEECRLVADSLAPMTEVKEPLHIYREIIQARLDALHFNEDAYCWLEGYMGLVPCHRTSALKFVKSIVKILVDEVVLPDNKLVHIEEFKDVPTLDPMAIAKQMYSDAQELLGAPGTQEHAERRAAWRQRVSRYFAYCIDGGLIGERFTFWNILQSQGRMSNENEKMIKSVIDFLLMLRLRDSTIQVRTPLTQLLQSPEDFSKYSFNERIMRTLLTEGYLQIEWRKKVAASGGTSGSHCFEQVLAALLTSDDVGIGLRSLICRQILEATNQQTSSSSDGVDPATQALIPALVKVMGSSSLSLQSCATAALVNLSCGKMSTKTLLMSTGCMKHVANQLKAKDDDLTLYTLYLLVNMTKTPQHRLIAVKEGGVPLLVEILTSSYQNPRRRKILTEVASVIGQLCNDADTRALLSDGYPYVVPCLLWIYEAAPVNSKLKSKILFALRQLCQQEQNKMKVAKQVIPQALEELGQATPAAEEAATNCVLLLTTLATIKTNAIEISGGYDQALTDCGLYKNGEEARHLKFSRDFVDRVKKLRDKLREQQTV